MSDFRMRADHGMSNELLKEIGDFVVSFAEIEYALKLGIQTLLNCSIPHKRVITAHQNVSNLIIMLREIYRTSSEQRVPIETIENLCKEAEEICAFRNDLMHSTITSVDKETFEMEKKKSRKFDLKFQEVNIIKIQEITKKTQYVAGDMIGIWMGYHKITPRVV